MNSKPPQSVEAEVLGLPLEERARLAYRLLDSMDMDLERKTAAGTAEPEDNTRDASGDMWDERFAATVAAILQRMTPVNPPAAQPINAQPAGVVDVEPAPSSVGPRSHTPDPERGTFVDWEERLDLEENEPQPVIVGVGVAFPDWKSRRLLVSSVFGGAAAALVVLGLVIQGRQPAPSEFPPLMTSITPAVQPVTWKEIPTVQPSLEPSRLTRPVVSYAEPERPPAAQADPPAPQRPRPPQAAPRPAAPNIPAIPTLAASLIVDDSVARPAEIRGPVSLPTPPTQRTASAPVITASRTQPLPPVSSQTERPLASGVPASQAARFATNEPMASRFDVVPQVRDANRVRQALERAYPSSLRDWGIGGQAEMWFYVNEQGVVDSFKLKKTSGNKFLDEAALKAAQTFEFTPGRLGDEPTAGWVSLPIVFNGL